MSKGSEREEFWRGVYDGYAKQPDIIRQTGRRAGDVFSWLLDARFILDLLQRYAGRDKRMLSVGCANGLFEYMASGLFERVVGIDISESQIYAARMMNLLPNRRGKRIANIHFQQNSAHHLEYVNGWPWDVILCAGAFHYIPGGFRPLKTLKNFARHLNPFGVAILHGIPHAKLKLQLQTLANAPQNRAIDRRLFTELNCYEPQDLVDLAKEADPNFDCEVIHLPEYHPDCGERFTVVCRKAQYTDDEKEYWVQNQSEVLDQ